MSNQAQIDALEHLLLSVIKSSEVSVAAYEIFENAQSSIMGSNGPGGPTQKTAAMEYLKHLKILLE